MNFEWDWGCSVPPKSRGWKVIVPLMCGLVFGVVEFGEYRFVSGHE